MTIEVAGGAALLASAKILNGPCSHLLVQSSGEAGVPTGYAAVQVTYNGTTTAPLPLCTIEVRSLDGQVLDVTAEATVTTSEQACCPAQTCCAKSQAATVQRTITFKQDVQTVTFEPLDAGVVEAGVQLDSGGGGDAGNDDAPLIGASDTGEPIDAAIDVAFDGALDVGIDGGGFDTLVDL
jgi:hypothetical protein